MLFRAQMWPQRKRSRSTRRPRLPRYLPSDDISDPFTSPTQGFGTVHVCL